MNAESRIKTLSIVQTGIQNLQVKKGCKPSGNRMHCSEYQEVIKVKSYSIKGPSRIVSETLLKD